jgi:multiple sugar transport system substrate-binding protein
MKKRAWFIYVVALVVIATGFVFAGSSKTKEEGEVTTISVVTLANNELGDTLKAVLPMFEEENPSIKVILEPLGFDTLWNKVKLDYQSDAGTWDVPIMWGWWSSVIMAGEHAVPLNDYMKRDGIDPNDYVPELLDEWSWEEKIYGIPYHSGVYTMFYRKDLFEDADEKAAFKAKYGHELLPPETWKDYMEIGEFFTRPDENFYGLSPAGKAQVDLPFIWMIYLKSVGREPFGPDWMPDFDNKDSIDFFNLWVKSFDYAPPGNIAVQHFETEPQFMNFKTATLISWTPVGGMIGNPDLGPLQPEQVGTLSIPKGEGPNAVHSSMGGTWGMTINPVSKHKEEAWTLIKWLTTHEEDLIAAHLGYTPARIASYNVPELKDLDYMQASLRGYNNMVMPPPFAEYTDEWMDRMMKLVSSVFGGATTPEDAAREGQAITLELAKKSGVYKGQ